ncbi:hypothetical protein CR205_01850 [Alteribacter lacisalsi]|uniref:EAL domain-containing protein n=1 Tax=Alteribacter lacisalsi TaxID=2045244 RepID=A0A2W0HJY4_9BACI|nr:EAL domain-containing protein [Alteribacter lacisalsi]PYZ97372.1 hypothetical protein CR205_01850 [Alteribacter lacisalsi]
MFRTFEDPNKQNFAYFIERLNQTLDEQTLFLLTDVTHAVLFASPSFYRYTGFHAHQIEGSDYRPFEMGGSLNRETELERSACLLSAEGIMKQFTCTRIPMIKDYSDEDEYSFLVYTPAEPEGEYISPNPSWMDRDMKLPNEKAFRYVTENNRSNKSGVLCLTIVNDRQERESGYKERIRCVADELRGLQSGMVSAYYPADSMFALLCEGSLTGEERKDLQWKAEKACRRSRLQFHAAWQPAQFKRDTFEEYMNRLYESRLYSGAGTGDNDRKQLIENRFEKALERERLSLVYQPQVNLHDRSVSGAEALLRWEDEVLGAVSPREFIPVAEASRMIIPAGYWVLKEACRQAAVWRESGLHIRMSVNLSPVQCEDEDFASKVKKIVAQSGIAPDMLTLEITENQLLYHLPEARVMLRELKAYGINISIDDFGTGYSSFSYLKHFPVDTVKIDQSFIRDMGRKEDKSDEKIVTTIINLARNMNMKVVAEGVEKGETLDFLSENQCDEIQGFLYCRPLSSEEVIPFLQADAAGNQLFLDK